MRTHRTLRHESLKSRLVMYNLSGLEWDQAEVSYSLVPDGTPWNTARGSGESELFTTMNGLAASDGWLQAIDRAFQNWANHSSLNFNRADEGGDIQIAAIDANGADAWAYYPGPGLGGDITLNVSASVFNTHWSELRFGHLMMHEIGHSLGLDHTEVLGTVMGIGSPRTDLAADDIAGIQAIYGPREEYADRDYYQFTVPSSLTVGSLRQSLATTSVDVLPAMTIGDLRAYLSPEVTESDQKKFVSTTY